MSKIKEESWDGIEDEEEDAFDQVDDDQDDWRSAKKQEVTRSGVKTRSARRRSAKLNEEYVYASNSVPKLEDDDEYVDDDKRKKKKSLKKKLKKKKKSKKDSKKKKRRRADSSDDERVLVVDDPNSYYASDEYDSDGRLIKKDEIKKKIEEEEREARRLKRKPNTPHLIKKYTPVPMGSDGKPIMPIQLRGLTIHNLGNVVWDKAKFHAKRYIWPVGFKSSRIYSSMTQLDKKCLYTSEIIMNNDEPSFVVTCWEDKDNPIIIARPTASGAWAEVGKRFFELKKEVTGKDTMTQLSGPEMFGFAHPTIAKLIQEMPGADKCDKYTPQQFVPSSAKIKGIDDKPKYRYKKKRESDESSSEDSDDDDDMDDDDDSSDESSSEMESVPVEPIQVKKKQRKAPGASPTPVPIKAETPKPQRQQRRKKDQPETPKAKAIKAEPNVAASPTARAVESKPAFTPIASPVAKPAPPIFDEEEEEVVEEESGTVFVPQNYASNNGMSINKLLS